MSVHPPTNSHELHWKGGTLMPPPKFNSPSPTRHTNPYCQGRGYHECAMAEPRATKGVRRQNKRLNSQPPVKNNACANGWSK